MFRECIYICPKKRKRRNEKKVSIIFNIPYLFQGQAVSFRGWESWELVWPTLSGQDGSLPDTVKLNDLEVKALPLCVVHLVTSKYLITVHSPRLATRPLITTVVRRLTIFLVWQKDICNITHPETNIAPEKMLFWRENHLQPLLFRCYVL